MGKGRQGGRFYLRTQLNDALIESYDSIKRREIAGLAIFNRLSI